MFHFFDSYTTSLKWFSESLHPYSREMRRPDAEGPRQSSRANMVGGVGGGPLREAYPSLYLPRAPPPSSNANWNYRPGEYQPSTFRHGTSTSAGVYDRSSNMTGRASTGGSGQGSSGGSGSSQVFRVLVKSIQRCYLQSLQMRTPLLKTRRVTGGLVTNATGTFPCV